MTDMFVMCLLYPRQYKMVLHFDNFRFNSNTTDGTSGVAWTVYISGASEFIPSFRGGGGIVQSLVL